MSSNGGIGGRLTVSEPVFGVADALEEISKEKKPKRRKNLVGGLKNIALSGAQAATKFRMSSSLYSIAGAELEPLQPEQMSITSSLAVLGDTMAGKTTLLTRFIQHNFFSDYQETLAPQFYAKNFQCEDTSGTRSARIRMQLWDTPGNQLMRACLPVWIKAAKVVLLVFSVAGDEGPDNFKAAKELVTMVNGCVDNSFAPVLFFVGTKLDETPSQGRFLPEEELRDFARSNEAHYFEVSSRTGVGFDELFSAVGQAIFDAEVARESAAAPGWIPDRSTPVCLLCKALFTLTNRRHHCRNCGGLFCGRCSSKFIALPQIGKHLPTRVCNVCYDLRTSEQAAA